MDNMTKGGIGNKTTVCQRVCECVAPISFLFHTHFRISFIAFHDENSTLAK